MRSLFVRFFLSFWLIIGITIGSAALGGFWYAERLREAIEDIELGVDDWLLEAGEALEAGGREGLVRWLRAFPQSGAVSIFVFDSRGHDILDRRPPYGVRRTLRRHDGHRHGRRDSDEDPRSLRRSRPLPQLVAANGDTYTFIAAPAQMPDTVWTNADARWLLLVLAILISGLVSYGLARAISRPVQKLRDATIAFADGKLDVRVADSLGRRNDELGMLGQDFDAMAENLQTAVEQQIELSRNVSHELRSPLARMRVALELAKRQVGDLPELDRLVLEAEHLDDLVGQILSYTRLDSGSRSEPQPVDLEDVIREVAENVNFECRSEGIAGISVHTEIAASPRFSGYRDALTSAIENVVRNGVYHSPANGEVRVSLNQADRTAVIEIRDDGPGVEASDLAKLFDPFFRTRASASTGNQHGTGLGLAIAERAVRKNKGQITACNHDDGGLVVRITLPLRLDSAR